MNIEAKEQLEKIVAKEPRNLTEADIGFLKARKSYLSETHKTKFADVLDEKETINLLDLKRAELDELAIKVGLNPEDYANKTEIATAISDTQQE